VSHNSNSHRILVLLEVETRATLSEGMRGVSRLGKRLDTSFSGTESTVLEYLSRYMYV
jgi:hypothetical protein